MSTPSEERSARLRKADTPTRVIGLHGDHDAFDRAYYRSLEPSERLALVWSMFAEQWLLKGGDASELRLRRDVAVLHRKRG
jgi:hypothetical protein